MSRSFVIMISHPHEQYRLRGRGVNENLNSAPPADKPESGSPGQQTMLLENGKYPPPAHARRLRACADLAFHFSYGGERILPNEPKHDLLQAPPGAISIRVRKMRVAQQRRRWGKAIINRQSTQLPLFFFTPADLVCSPKSPLASSTDGYAFSTLSNSRRS